MNHDFVKKNNFRKVMTYEPDVFIRCSNENGLSVRHKNNF